MATNERPYPSTEMIVGALRALGVTGPAVAQDVLNAAGTNLPPEQVPEVLNAITRATTDRADPTETGPTGGGDPGE